MPQLVQYGDSGVIEFPDGMPQDEIAAVLKDKRDELQQRFSKGPIRSAALSFARGAVESIGQTISGLGRSRGYSIPRGVRSLMMQMAMADEGTPEERGAVLAPMQDPRVREKLVEEQPLSRIGREISEGAREAYQPNPEYARKFFTGTLPAAAGSTLPVIAAAVTGGPIPAALQYGLSAGEQTAQEATEAGKPEAAERSFFTNAGLGAITEFGLGVPANIVSFARRARQLGVSPESAGAQVRSELGKRISRWLESRPVTRTLAEGVGREAGQESLEQFGQNWIAREFAGYDPNRPLTQGVVEAAAAGGLLGGLFGGGAYTVGRIAEREEERAYDRAFQSASTLGAQETAALISQPRNVLVGQEPGAVRQTAIPPSEVSRRRILDQNVESAMREAEDEQLQQAIKRRSYAVQVPSATSVPVNPPPQVSEQVAPGARPAEEPSRTSAQIKAPEVAVVDVSAVERVRHTENGGRLAIVLPDGTAVIGGRIHADLWNKAVSSGAANDQQLSDGHAGFVRPDGTAWGVNGKSLPNVSKVIIVDDVSRPRPPALPGQRPPPPVVPPPVPVPAAPAVQAAPPAQPAPPAPVAVPSMDEFLGLVDFEARDPAYVGLPFQEDLPADIKELGELLVKGGRVEGRTEKRRFAFVSDNETGQVHLLPVWKNTKKTNNVVLRRPGQQSGAGVNLQTFHMEQTGQGQPKYTFLSSVLLKNPAHSFPRSFTQDEYDAIRDGARDQAGNIVSQQDLFTTSTAPIDVVPESEQVPVPVAAPVQKGSGIPVSLVQELYDLFAENPGVTPLDLMKQNTAFFERFRGVTKWNAATLWQQLRDAINTSDESFDKFHQAFDPLSYAPSTDDTGAGRGGTSTPTGNLAGTAVPATTTLPPPTAEKASIGVRESIGGLVPFNYGFSPEDISAAGGDVKSAIDAQHERLKREAILERASDVYDWNTSNRRWGQIWTAVKQDDTTRLWRVIAGLEGNLKGLDIARLESMDAAYSFAKDFREGTAFALENNGRWIKMVESAIATKPLPAHAAELLKSHGRTQGVDSEGRTVGIDELRARYVPSSIAVSRPPTVIVSEQDTANAVQRWKEDHPQAPVVVVVNDTGLVRVDSAGNERGIRGQFRPDRFLVNRAFLASPEDIIATLDHEYTHSLLASPDGLEALSVAILADLGVEQRSELRQRYRRDEGESDTAYDARIMEEWFAQLSETQPNLWQRIVARVRQWLSQFGLVRLTDEEIGQEILRALRASREAPTTEAQERENLTKYIYRTAQERLEAQSVSTATPEGIAEVERIAGVQAGLIPDTFVNELATFNSAPRRSAASRTGQLLKPISDLSTVSLFPQQLVQMPRTTDAESRESELAAGTLVAHNFAIGGALQGFNRQLADAVENLARAGQEISKAQIEDLELHYANSKMTLLLDGYEGYLTDVKSLATEGGNMTVALDNLLDQAVRQVKQMQPSLGALGGAFQAIARNIPDTLIKPGAPSAPIVAWVTGNLTALRSEAGEGALTYLVTQKSLPNDPNALVSPLAQYSGLAEDLTKMRALQQAKLTARTDIQEFKQWFANMQMPTKAGRTAIKVSPIAFAKEYYRLRKQKEQAAEAISSIVKEAYNAEREVIALTDAIDYVERLQKDPAYLASVRLATEYSNPIVQHLSSVNDAGQTEYVGPLGTKYLFDFKPDKVPEINSQAAIQALIDEIDTFSSNPESDPALVNSWQLQKQYLADHLLGAYATSGAGGPVNGMPFGQAQLSLDVYDWVSRGAFIRRLLSPQGLLNRIATKQAQATALVFQATDAFTEPTKVANENKDFGWKAVNNLAVAGIRAHGWNPNFDVHRKDYDHYIIDPIVASLQNNLSRQYKVGELIAGKWRVLPEDMETARATKRWQDAINKYANPPGKTGSPTLRFNPVQPEREEGGTTYSTIAMGTGPMVMARISKQWGAEFVPQWLGKTSRSERLSLLDNSLNFNLAVLLGRVEEPNRLEYTRKSDLQNYYDDAAKRMRLGLLQFNTMDELVDWIANEKYAAEPNGPTLQEQRELVEDIILKDVTEDVESFNRDYLNAKRDPKSVHTVPESLRSILTGKNSFTAPRSHLVAPSSYYSYSLVSDPRKAQYIASARLVFELRQLTALDDLRKTLKSKLAEMEKELSETKTPKEKRKVRGRLQRQSLKDTRLGETLVVYQELKLTIQKLDTLYDELNRLALREYKEPDHIAWGFAKGISGLGASSLLSSPQASTTNAIGGIVFAPGMINVRQGRLLRALASPITTPARTVQLASRWVASIIRGNKLFEDVWNRNPQQWGAIATLIAEMSDHYNDIYNRAMAVGAIAPYDLKGRWKLLNSLRSTGGRMEMTEPSTGIKSLNRLFSLPLVSHGFAWLKSVSPRWIDQMVNMFNVQNALIQLEQIKTYGLQAWDAHEKLYGADYDDLTNQRNLLTPKELGATTAKGATFIRQLYNPAGNIDAITLDYYKRTKGMTPEQRAQQEFMDEGAINSYILEFLKVANLAAQSNRPPFFRGGLLRPMLTMFMGYPAAQAEHLSEITRTHSADPKFKATAVAIASIFTILVIGILAGGMARETGQELTEIITGKATGQLRLANLLTGEAEANDVARYMLVSSANIIPYFNEVANRAIGGVASKPVLDITAMIPVASFINDSFGALLKSVTSRDPVYPLTDWGKRWFPPLTPVINRIPMFAGDTAQRNALATLRAVATSDMEVKQTFGTTAPKLTPTSPIVRDMIAAAYLGDTDTVRQKYAEAVEEKRRQGVENPERAVWSTIQSRIPARSVFGRLPTESEETRLLSRMTDSQKDIYGRSRQAFGLIADVAGQQLSFVDVSVPRAAGGGTVAGRRSIVSSRRGLTSLGRRRRSLFGRRGRRISPFGRRIRRRRRVGFGSSRRSLVA